MNNSTRVTSILIVRTLSVTQIIVGIAFFLITLRFDYQLRPPLVHLVKISQSTASDVRVITQEISDQIELNSDYVDDARRLSGNAKILVDEQRKRHPEIQTLMREVELLLNAEGPRIQRLGRRVREISTGGRLTPDIESGIQMGNVIENIGAICVTLGTSVERQRTILQSPGLEILDQLSDGLGRVALNSNEWKEGLESINRALMAVIESLDQSKSLANTTQSVIGALAWVLYLLAIAIIANGLCLFFLSSFLPKHINP
jgi:hypothetical protein